MALTTEQYKALFVDKFKLLKPEQFDRVLKSSQETKRPMDQLLMERAFITPRQYLELLGNYFNLPITDLDVRNVDLEVLKSLPESVATQHMAIAFAKGEHNALNVAICNPADVAFLENIKANMPYVAEIKLFITTEYALRRALILYDGDLKERITKIVNKLSSNTTQTDTDNLANSVMIDLVNNIIESGVIYEASDIHIEPAEAEAYIRFRIDGYLRTIARLPMRFHAALLSRLKIMADLKIDQKQIPQDGRFTADVKGQQVNVRLSTVPSLWGEKPVMRLLPKEAHLFDVNNLGLIAYDLAIIRNHIKRPHGLILVCGPTGSGKTTTLYALLQEIGTERIDAVNISTIEDPIEYTMPHVTQIQTRPELKLTFASGLRALLRQDPDIIMVGEIRDAETADFAVRAALVGRLVFSSLHTNDAPGAIPRLLDMGLEPYVVSSTLTLVVAQRLARKLCNYCRQSYTPTADQIEELRRSHNLDTALQTLVRVGVLQDAKSALRFYQAVGCTHCDNTGYKGRVGLYEILQVNDQLRQLINARADSSEVTKIAQATGMKTMFEDGLAKVVMGEVDLAEVLKAAYS